MLVCSVWIRRSVLRSAWPAWNVMIWGRTLHPNVGLVACLHYVRESDKGSRGAISLALYTKTSRNFLATRKRCRATGTAKIFIFARCHCRHVQERAARLFVTPDNIAATFETARVFVARKDIVSKGSVALLQRGGGHYLFLTYWELHPRFGDTLLGIWVWTFLQWFRPELFSHASGVQKTKSTLHFFLKTQTGSYTKIKWNKNYRKFCDISIGTEIPPHSFVFVFWPFYCRNVVSFYFFVVYVPTLLFAAK